MAGKSCVKGIVYHRADEPQKLSCELLRRIPVLGWRMLQYARTGNILLTQKLTPSQ